MAVMEFSVTAFLYLRIYMCFAFLRRMITSFTGSVYFHCVEACFFAESKHSVSGDIHPQSDTNSILDTSYQYQLPVYNFHSPISDIVLTLNPKHWIFCLELLCDTFLFGKLVHKPVKHILCLLFNVSKMWIELALSQHIVVDNTMMFLKIPSAALTPYADFIFRLPPEV